MGKLIGLLLILFLSNFISAQTVLSKYAGEFISIGVGGRALGMGGAFSAISNDITAAYYNPAGLANLNYPQFALMHDERYGNLVNYNYAAVALPFEKDMTFALTATRLAVDGIPDTRNALVDGRNQNVIFDINNPNARIDPSRITEFSNQDWAFYLSFAKKLEDNFSYGANVKIIYRSIAEFNAFGLGVDVGALYSPLNNFYLAANLQDITTTLVAWSTGRNELVTPTLKLGTAYMYEFGWGKITPAMDFDIRFENRKFASQFNLGPVSFDAHFGLEFVFKNLIALRGGFNDVKQFTAGAGIKLPKLNIDYSFARFNMSELDRLPDTHRISLILTLEEPRFLRSN